MEHSLNCQTSINRCFAKSDRVKSLVKNQSKILFWNDPITIQTIKEQLLQEEIIITTTDTIPGLLANITSQSYQKLRQLKGDRGDKPFLILITASQLSQFVDVSTLNRGVIALTQQCWPGPLTIIFKARPDLAPFLVSAAGTIALRCPTHEGLQKLLHLVPGVFAPSANRSNQPPPQSLSNVDQELIDSTTSMVGDQESIITTQASTIIDVTHIQSDDRNQVANIHIVREGTYSKKVIEGVYESAYIQ